MTMFSSRLRGLRAETEGLKQSDVAAAVGVSVQSFSTYENGREPSYETLIKIAKYYDCTLDYLLGCSEYRNTESVHAANAKMQAIIEKTIAIQKNSDVFSSLLDGILGNLDACEVLGETELFEYLSHCVSGLGASAKVTTEYIDDTIKTTQNLMVNYTEYISSLNRAKEMELDKMATYYRTLIQYAGRHTIKASSSTGEKKALAATLKMLDAMPI